MKKELRKTILGFGADVCGFAAIEGFSAAPKGFHPRDILPNCKSVVVFGMALPKGIFLADSPLVYSYFNLFACPQVDRIAYQTAVELEKTYNVTGVPMPCDGPYDDWDQEKMEGRGLLSMKHAAVLAGIGTLGKNTLLLNKEYGNRLVIGCVLTDLEMESDVLASGMCLENCDLCIRNCPAGAINQGDVNQKACRTYSEGKTKRGFDISGCNRCRNTCPMNFRCQAL